MPASQRTVRMIRLETMGSPAESRPRTGVSQAVANGPMKSRLPTSTPQWRRMS